MDLGREQPVLRVDFGRFSRTQHLGNVGAVDIAVHEAYVRSLERERKREIHGGRRLADAAFPRANDNGRC